MEQQVKGTVLVTGANSLLATNTIKSLLDKGYMVKGLLRQEWSFIAPRHPYLTLVTGDVTKKEDLENAINGCNYIIHIAGVTDQTLLYYSDYEKVNVEATRLVMEVAVENGIKRVVYVSSSDTLARITHNELADETSKMTVPWSKSPYAQSKIDGQKMALSFKNKVDIISVNPSLMLGAYDSKPSSGQIILMGYKRLIIFIPCGGRNFVNVVDVAQGCVAALEQGKNGEIYLLTGENMSYKTFMKKICCCTGQKSLIVIIPAIFLRIAGIFGDLLRYWSIKTDITSFNTRIINNRSYFTNEKARTELGVEFGPIEIGITTAIQWFKSRGILQK